jgi:hypothetical protein
MARVIRPTDAPKDGTLVWVFGGPADGHQIEVPGMYVRYEELTPMIGKAYGYKLYHVYMLTEKQHVVTGEKMWVYEFQGTE